MTRLSSRQGLEYARRSVKAHSRGHQPHMFAVLETRNPPADECLILVQDSDAEPSSKFEFRSLAVFDELEAVLGILCPRSHSSALRHSSMKVKRGRLGNKNAEHLLILNRIPVGFLDNPGPVLKGMLKSIERALSQISYSGRAHNLHWWLALELAMKGWVRRASVDNLAAELELSVPQFKDGIIASDGLYVWKEYLERTLDQLEASIQSPKNQNPLADHLVAENISNLLGIRDNGVIGVLIHEFARRHGCIVSDDVVQSSCRLPDSLVPELPESDRLIAEEILNLYDSGEGVSRFALEQKYPSNLNIVARLFLSGKLVASPEGFIFTRTQLLDYRNKLLESGEDLSMLSIRTIKDQTGLGRKAAEALQSLFSELFRDGYEHGNRELKA